MAPFAGVVLIDGILTIVLIGLLQAIGWWEVPASEGPQGATTELLGRLRIRAAVAA